MKPSEVIESYVHDAARQLPPKKRNDVAMELRSLLTEELHARAEAEGREPDRDMAMAILAGFGRPAETAARYHEMPAIVAPADTHYFLVAAIAGAAVALVASLFEAGDDAGEAFLQWLGFLVLVFGGLGVWRRRRPDGLHWTPKPVRDPDRVNRASQAVTGLACLIPFAIWVSPQAMMELVTAGWIPDGMFAYSRHFIDGAMWPVLAALLAASCATHLAVAAMGRWGPWTRGAHVALTGLTGAALIGLAVDGPIFARADVSEAAAAIVALVGACILLGAAWEGYRWWARVAPAPQGEPA